MDRAACHGSEHPPPPPDRPLAARGTGRKPWHILGENGWRILTENLQGAAATPELGSPQAARMARRPPPGARAARSKYGGRSLAPPGTRAAAPPPPSLEASGRARTRYRGTEQRVDRGLQGPLPHRRWRVLLPPHGRRPA